MFLVLIMNVAVHDCTVAQRDSYPVEEAMTRSAHAMVISKENLLRSVRSHANAIYRIPVLAR